MNNTADLRNKKLIRSVFGSILLPALLAGASANLAGIIDGIIVGNFIGSEAVAAVNACRPAMQVYGFISEIFASGLATCIAISIGRGKKDDANGLFSTGMLSSLAAAVILTVLQLVFVKDICRVFADDETLFPQALEYYRYFLLSVFFILLSEPLAALMRTDGMPKLSGAVLLLPHIVNAILDIVLIRVFGLGLTGAAVATVLGYAAGFLVCCYYFFFKRSYRFRKSNYPKDLGDIASVGLPPAVNMGLITVKLLIVNRLVLSYGGTMGMTAMSMVMIAWALESLFIGGIKQAMMPMVSFYYGNGDYHGVLAVFGHACRLLMGLEFALLIFLEIFPQSIPLLFGLREAEEMACAVTAMRIFAIQIPMEGFIMLAITYYTATKNKKTATLLSVLLGLGATVVVIYPLVHFFGLVGVWMSFPAASLVPILVIVFMSRGNSEKFFRMKGVTYLKEFSIDFSQITGTVENVIRAVGDAGFDSTVANRTGIAIEEMAVSAFERNKGKKLHVDVTVRKIGEDLLVTFSDDGVEFDPTVSTNAGGAEQLDNIAMLKLVSHKIEYGRVIGINKTDIVLK